MPSNFAKHHRTDLRTVVKGEYIIGVTASSKRAVGPALPLDAPADAEKRRQHDLRFGAGPTRSLRVLEPISERVQRKGHGGIGRLVLGVAISKHTGKGRCFGDPSTIYFAIELEGFLKSPQQWRDRVKSAWNRRWLSHGRLQFYHEPELHACTPNEPE